MDLIISYCKEFSDTLIVACTTFILYIIIVTVIEKLKLVHDKNIKRINKFVEVVPNKASDFNFSDKYHEKIFEKNPFFNIASILKNTVLWKIFQKKMLEKISFTGVIGIAFGCIAFFSLKAYIFHIPSPMLLTGLIIFGIFIVDTISNHLILKKKIAFSDEFPNALDVFKRGLRAGMSTVKAIELVSFNSKPPISKVFDAIYKKTVLGESLHSVLDYFSSRVVSEDFKFFAVAIKIQEETGGNMTETIANLAAMMRKRYELRLKIKAISSETLMTGKVLIFLPFFLMAIILYTNPGHLDCMFNSNLGIEIIIITLMMFCLGSVLIFRISRIKA